MPIKNRKLWQISGILAGQVAALAIMIYSASLAVGDTPKGTLAEPAPGISDVAEADAASETDAAEKARKKRKSGISLDLSIAMPRG